VNNRVIAFFSIFFISMSLPLIPAIAASNKYAADFNDYYSCLSGSNATLYSGTINACKQFKAKGAEGKLAEYSGCLYHLIYIRDITLFSEIIKGCTKYKPAGTNVAEYNYSACLAHARSVTLYSERLKACKKYK